jgi:hypothetical protein
MRHDRTTWTVVAIITLFGFGVLLRVAGVLK